jgi:ABC-2 type transport system ATP-binding protein
MGDVERTCDRVVVLDGGSVLRTGAVASFTEETETLVVELVDGAEALHRELERRGVAARLDGGRLTIEHASGDAYDTVRDAIVDTGALLYRLAPARHDLADVFSPAAAEEVA